jgi:multisubunit Na+/H+ antiporter MnhB subunit
MIVELVTTGILIFQIPVGIPNWTVIVGIILIGVIWISTLFLQIPYHNKLSSKFDKNALMMLVNTNWIRTICWSLRGIIVLIMLDTLMKTHNL